MSWLCELGANLDVVFYENHVSYSEVVGWLLPFGSALERLDISSLPRHPKVLVRPVSSALAVDVAFRGRPKMDCPVVSTSGSSVSVECTGANGLEFSTALASVRIVSSS